MGVLDFAQAIAAVRGIARRTPLLEAPELSEKLGAPVLLKAECLQVTGSFKVRGAAARLAALSDDERSVESWPARAATMGARSRTWPSAWASPRPCACRRGSTR